MAERSEPATPLREIARLWDQVMIEWRSLTRPEAVFLALVMLGLVALWIAGPGGLAVAGATLAAGVLAGIAIAASRRRHSG